MWRGEAGGEDVAESVELEGSDCVRRCKFSGGGVWGRDGPRGSQFRACQLPNGDEMTSAKSASLSKSFNPNRPFTAPFQGPSKAASIASMADSSVRIHFSGAACRIASKYSGYEIWACVTAEDAMPPHTKGGGAARLAYLIAGCGGGSR